MSCNGTFLQCEVRAMVKRLWSNMKIEEEDVHNALCFVNDSEKLKEFMDNDFLQSADNAKQQFVKSQSYQCFADYCKKFFTLGNDHPSSLIAVCIFFREVTREYAPYYSSQYTPRLEEPDYRTEEEKTQFLQDYLQKFRERRKKKPNQVIN